MAIEQSGAGRSGGTDSSFEPPRPHCFCGGTFRLDTQYLVDAERYALTRHVPVLWRCQMCGRSLTRTDQAAPAPAPEKPGAARGDEPLLGADLLTEAAPRAGRQRGEGAARSKPRTARSGGMGRARRPSPARARA